MNDNNNLNTQPNNEILNSNTTEVPTITPQPTVTPEVPVMPEVPVTPVEVAPVVPEVPAMPPQPTMVNNGMSTQNDPNAIVNENLKKVEINYTPPSKAKVVLLILFFIFLVGFIIFLPEINTMVNRLKAGDTGLEKEEDITTGKLICTLDTSTAKLDKSYYLTFNFTDSKLEKTNFVITTKGDITLDEETLNGLNDTCNQLKKNVSEISGVSVQCSYSDGKLVETQVFELKDLDSDKLDAAFTEAGGNNPEYQYGQDIGRIERGMNASGYTCKRER